ncbi:MAG: SIS domain-containing protein [Herpetosiphon sp.]
MEAGSHTRQEITSQPAVWQAVLDQMETEQEALRSQLADLPEQPLVVTGCGSTYYLALYAAAVLRSVGVRASAVPASELVYLPQKHLGARFNLLAISRSGTTSETVWAVERFRRLHPKDRVITITCVPETPLLLNSDVQLVAGAAQEQSIAQTRSFTSMTLLVQVLAGCVADDAGRLKRIRTLPSSLQELIGVEQAGLEEIGRDPTIERFFFLGNGPLYGLACEAMLKTKEMACAWAEAYHALEFRHGPMSLAGKGALVVGLISDSAAEAEIKVLQDMQRLGASTLALTPRPEQATAAAIDRVIGIRTTLDEWERGSLYVPLLQWIAFHHSLAHGMDPDRPVNLSAVVAL